MAIGINDLANISGIKIPSVNQQNKDTEKSGFDQLLQGAMNVLNDTNTAIKEADQMAVDFALGKVDNISDVMIAQEKASVALQYTVQLRDAFLDAYNEIMRMQI